ncbi:P-loop NTPase [Natronococcus occultus]|uniref:ATPase involved in chromosome partitioning n=1 Tax=Natronococcus occultus SP4 TaxID=694430 RepID=L0JYB9_9EURY|nr:P-loop NTPase [Natronococcus occultus]AGB36833.1 ATPase involved in chromosome partitioning [Natronococcus occultus SP4]
MEDETPRTDEEIKRAVIDRTREVQLADGDPVSEQLLEDVSVEDGVVTFTVVFDRLNRRLSERLSDQLRGAGLATEGIDHVRIEATDAEAPESGLPVTGVDSLIAIGSAKGGVGKTTITAALARALNESGLDVAVFDANVYAPDIPDLLGAEGPVQNTPSGRPKPIEADGIEVVSLDLIAEDGPVAWRGAMVHDVLKDLLGDATWDDRDVLLVDLPPGIGDAVYTIVQQAPLDGALLVSTPTDAGVRATERTGALFTANDVETIGVVPNMTATGAESSPYEGDGRELEDAINEEAIASIDPVPFDSALRTPTACSFGEDGSPGERAVAALGETVAEFVAGRGGSRAPADAIDLRGLPPETCKRQAITELAVSDGELTLLCRHDPEELRESIEETLASDGKRLDRVDIEDIGQEGWVLELETELLARSEPLA